MKEIVLFFTFALASLFSFAQSQKEAVLNPSDSEGEVIEQLIQYVEDPAAPLMGYKGVYELLNKTITVPSQCTWEGKIYIQFIVTEEGKTSDFKIMKGAYPELDRIVFSQFKALMEGIEYKPAIQRWSGKPYKQRHVIPVFIRQDKVKKFTSPVR